MLLIEVAEATWSGTLCLLLERFKPSGLLFHKLSSPEATLEICRESARVLGTLPLMAIEEEGGGALSALLAALPRALTLDANGAEQAGALIGQAMKLLGLNLTLAPTLDIEPFAATSLDSDMRSGSEGERIAPAEIAQRAESFVGGLRSHRILSCGRHFPGLSARTRTPREIKAIVLDRSLAALWREDLVPYRTMGERLAAIEISHAVHRAYDYEFLRPASLSPGVIEGLLRTKLGYRGIAIAHASLAARAAGIDLDEAVVRALAAGCDLVIIPGERKLLEAVCGTLARSVESGRLPAARVSQADARVRTAQRHVRRPARQLVDAEYSRLAREFEVFARKCGKEGNDEVRQKRTSR
jgi:beta-N-acetylhexosaminidase